MKKPYVIIPNWNGIDFIEECLRSLEAQTMEHVVIVVENGSTDGSVELIKSKFPQVQLLEFPNNAGFAGGVNRGIRPALVQGAEYIVLFNNDAIADPDWLEHLVETADSDPKLGIVTSKIRHFDDPKLDSTGDWYTTWGFSFPRGRDEIDAGQYDGEDKRVIFSGSGGASLYRAAMFNEVGIFDERFFAYYEDVDMGFRSQLYGWEARYEPTAVVRHHIGGTSSKHNNFARYHAVKNFIYLYTKDMPGWLYWKYLPLAILSYGMMFVSDVKRRQIGTFFGGTWEALIHLPGIMLDRWRIQEARKVSSKYINSMLYHGLPPMQMLRFTRYKKQPK